MASNKEVIAKPLRNLRFFLSLSLMGLLLSPSVAPLSVSAKPLKTKRASSKVLFIPPPTDKKPTKTSGAGSRGGKCMQASPVETSASPSVKALAKLPFMALMPVSNSGLTSVEHPSFWIYVPETSAKRMILSLRENGLKPHSQTFFNIPETPGVMSLSLPQSAPALEVGKTYQWAVALICAEKPSPNDPAIVSWISRIASAPPTQPNPLEQAAIYGKQGIWFDALAALGQARRSQPNQSELQATWADFLTSAGLQAIVSEPLRPETRP
jgi:Domain of Unknown Function (DUF928)